MPNQAEQAGHVTNGSFELQLRARVSRVFGGGGQCRWQTSHRCSVFVRSGLIALGPKPTEGAARRAVDECVRRFNDIDDDWICTIEREDIYEQIGRVVDACGFDCQEDWLDERDW